jgi:hypothetical protein
LLAANISPSSRRGHVRALSVYAASVEGLVCPVHRRRTGPALNIDRRDRLHQLSRGLIHIFAHRLEHKAGIPGGMQISGAHICRSPICRFRLDHLRMRREAVDGCPRPSARGISTIRASAPGSRCWTIGPRSPSTLILPGVHDRLQLVGTGGFEKAPIRPTGRYCTPRASVIVLS